MSNYTTREPGELALLAEIKECFRTAGERNKKYGEHCTFGEFPDMPVWPLLFPGESITVGGMTFPLYSDVSVCPEHHRKLIEMFGE